MTADTNEISPDIRSDAGSVAAPKAVWSTPVVTLFDASMGESPGDVVTDGPYLFS